MLSVCASHRSLFSKSLEARVTGIQNIRHLNFLCYFLTLVAVGISMINKSLEKGDSQPIPMILQSRFGLRVIAECAEAYFRNLSEAKNRKTTEGKKLPKRDSFTYLCH